MLVQSELQLHASSGVMPAMKPIDQTRRDNMERLAAEAKGVGNLARRLERSASQVSQWLNGSKSRTGLPRGMSLATCRYIEEKLGLPFGWMDAPHKAGDNEGRRLLEVTESNVGGLLREVAARAATPSDAAAFLVCGTDHPMPAEQMILCLSLFGKLTPVDRDYFLLAMRSVGAALAPDRVATSLDQA